MFIDSKYIGLISNRLLLFKRRGDSYNFRCPICGDSQRDKHKTRGYLIRKSNNTFYYCHNCNASLTFSNFLKYVDPELYNQYTQEVYIEKNGVKVQSSELDLTKIQTTRFITDSPLKSLKRISQLDHDHPAKRYVVSRKIPPNLHYKLFFAPKFKTWVNTIIPEKFDIENGDEPRMVIPLIDKDNRCFGVQGRSFSAVGVRYITIIFDENKPKIFGMDTVDFTKKTYVLEGPIDSMFLPNAIAMIGSNGQKVISEVAGNYMSNLVFVYDNEPRNKEICILMDKVIENGYNIVLWPDTVLNKDINEMIAKGGMTPLEVQQIIDSNTFSGLKASLIMAKWRK